MEHPPPVPVVLLTEPIAASATATLRRFAEVRVSDSPDPQRLRDEVTGVDAVIVRSSPLPSSVIDAAPRLRVIGRHGAGTENVAVAAASARGIPVVHTPGANADSVAEFVLLTVLTQLRRLPEVVDRFRSGRLAAGSLPGAVTTGGLLGRGLGGRTVGIVGFGAIGRRVATLLRAHDVHLLRYDPMVPDGDTLAVPTPLDELLETSDIITLHVPLTPSTENLLSADRIRRLRPEALVVNTARAEVVDTGALLAALDAGTVGGYVVDVFHPEPPDPDDPLLHHPKVLATPHMAAMTHEAMAAMADAVVSDVLTVLAGGRPLHVVNPEVLP